MSLYVYRWMYSLHVFSACIYLHVLPACILCVYISAYIYRNVYLCIYVSVYVSAYSLCMYISAVKGNLSFGNMSCEEEKRTRRQEDRTEQSLDPAKGSRNPTDFVLALWISIMKSLPASFVALFIFCDERVKEISHTGISGRADKYSIPGGRMSF